MKIHSNTELVRFAKKYKLLIFKNSKQLIAAVMNISVLLWQPYCVASQGRRIDCSVGTAACTVLVWC